MNRGHATGMGHGALQQRHAPIKAIDALAFAAAPLFALMAMVSHSTGSEAIQILCSSGRGSGLHGMTTMYLLMSVIHLAPWLKLLTRR